MTAARKPKVAGDARRAPAYQFYPGDEERDAGVRGCTLAAFGLWKRMQNLMHDAEPYGHLTSCGRAMQAVELARLVGETRRIVAKLLLELEVRGVFSRTAEGVIYSRRMVHDEYIRIVRAHAGKTGGNPALIDPPPVRDSDNPEVKQPDKQEVKQNGDQILTPAVAVAVASAGTTLNLTTARAALRDRLPDAYRGDLDRLLDRMRSDSARISWVFNLAQLLESETPNGPQHATPPAILGQAIREFNGEDGTSWIYFKSFPPKLLAANGTPSGNNGAARPAPRGGRVTASDRMRTLIANSGSSTA